MAYLVRADIPFHYALADAFTICDAYHCALMGFTHPNRYYMWTGWTGNDGKGNGPALDNSDYGYTWSTYPELLQNAGITWKVYQDIGQGLVAPNWGYSPDDAYVGNYGDNGLLSFLRYQRHSSYVPTPPSVQSMPVQESGGRPARAVPYEVHARSEVEFENGSLTIFFGNTGTSAAVYQVYTDKLP
jgi:phospholipase C